MDIFIVLCTVVVGCFAAIGWLTKSRRKPFTSQDTKSRELGVLEKTFYNDGSQGTLLTSEALFFATSQPLSHKTIRAALTRIGLRHPLYRMRITEENDGRCIFREMVNYEVDFTVSESSDWVAEFERQLKTLYDTNRGPLWRAVVMPNVPDKYSTDAHPHQTVILLNFHHCIIDGSSSTRLIYNQFIDNLEAIHHGDKCLPESQPLPPPLIQCIQLKSSSTEMLKATCLSYLCKIPFIRRIIIQRMASSLPPNPWVAVKGEQSDGRPNCEKTTSIVPFELDVEFTKKLTEKCKSEGATLQAAFQVATMGAMSDFLGSSPDVQWAAVVTVDMRRLYPEQLDAQHAVPYFGALIRTHTLPLNWKAKFWQCAREFAESLHKDMHAEVLRNISAFTSVAKCGLSWDVILSSHNGSRNQYYMSVNNMGNCNFLNRPDKNIVHLKAKFGGSAEHEFGPTVASCISTLQGRINWSLTYFKNVTTKEDAQSIAQGIQQALHSALR